MQANKSVRNKQTVQTSKQNNKKKIPLRIIFENSGL